MIIWFDSFTRIRVNCLKPLDKTLEQGRNLDRGMLANAMFFLPRFFHLDHQSSTTIAVVPVTVDRTEDPLSLTVDDLRYCPPHSWMHSVRLILQSDDLHRDYSDHESMVIHYVEAIVRLSSGVHSMVFVASSNCQIRWFRRPCWIDWSHQFSQFFVSQNELDDRFLFLFSRVSPLLAIIDPYSTKRRIHVIFSSISSLTVTQSSLSSIIINLPIFLRLLVYPTTQRLRDTVCSFQKQAKKINWLSRKQGEVLTRS